MHYTATDLYDNFTAMEKKYIMYTVQDLDSVFSAATLLAALYLSVGVSNHVGHFIERGGSGP